MYGFMMQTCAPSEDSGQPGYSRSWRSSFILLQIFLEYFTAIKDSAQYVRTCVGETIALIPVFSAQVYEWIRMCHFRRLVSTKHTHKISSAALPSRLRATNFENHTPLILCTALETVVTNTSFISLFIYLFIYLLFLFIASFFSIKSSFLLRICANFFMMHP